MDEIELTAQVAARAGLSETDARNAVEGVLDAIAEALGEGGTVSLGDFGTFAVIPYDALEVRDPRTGEPIHIPAGTRPKFAAGKRLDPYSPLDEGA